MSSEFHRPTLTYPTGTYNATQVRLYGIAPQSSDSGLMYPGKSIKFDSKFGDVEVQVCVSTNNKPEEINKAKKFDAVLAALKDQGFSDAAIFQGLVDKSLGDKVNDVPFVFDYVGKKQKEPAVVGFKEVVKEIIEEFASNTAYVSKISIQMKHLGNVSISASITNSQAVKSNKIISCGIIVGYSYEGQTFDLPKPKIMVIPTLPEPSIPEDDSGFDKKESQGYAVWLVDKLDECVEFELNQGFVEQLILDANLPGKRAPNTYAGRMMMGHRGGRLTE